MAVHSEAELTLDAPADLWLLRMLNPFIQKEPKRATDCKDGIHVGAYKWATDEPTLNLNPRA